MLSHLIDYTRWFNDDAEAEWVMAQAAGRGKLADMHPSPDYIAGLHPVRQRRARRHRVRRGRARCAGSRLLVAQVPHRRAGHRRLRRGADRRRLARGHQDRARIPAAGRMNYDLDMPPYIQEMADWLDDDKQGASLQFRERLQGLRNHDGLLPLGGPGRAGGAAADRGGMRSSC